MLQTKQCKIPFNARFFSLPFAMPSSQEKAKDLLSLSSSARMKALEAHCQASCPADLSI